MHKSVKKRLIFTLFSFLTISIVGSILVWQLKKNMVFFYTPTDLLQVSIADKNVWLGGLVKEYKYADHNGIVVHSFLITDNKNDVRTEYSGSLPKLFKVGQGVVVYGKFRNKEIKASRIAVKHDEVYMTKETYQKMRNQNY